jgi:hypothetical protein
MLEGWMMKVKSWMINHGRQSCCAAMLVFLATSSFGQLNENCVVSVLNRTVSVSPDGSWILPNVPAGFGPVRARATCVFNGITVSGQSDLFQINANRMNAIPDIILGATTPIPNVLAITSSTDTLTSPGATAQLTVTAQYPSGPAQDVTAAGTGTTYTISNPFIATITQDGLITAFHTGTALIQATNEGTQSLIAIRVVFGGADSDGDGIPDDYEIAHGMNPNNPTDAQADFDHDGLTNLQEFQLGTDPRNPDTDGDGLTDGQEVNVTHTNPLIADTDGDGIPDGLEVELGTDPLNQASFDYTRALASVTVSPFTFVLNVNVLQPDVSVQLKILGTFIGNFGTIDLTSRQRGTIYSTSNATICNFGATDGQVFAGNSGSCTITASLAGHSGSATGIVRSFTPTVMSEIPIPGFTNGIDVAGNFAYIASGPTGLQIVNVTNRNAPRIVGSTATPGNAEDVKVVGNYAYVADGASGLQIVDVSNPAAPFIAAALDTPGEARNLVVRAGRAYVADSTSGLQIIDVSNPLHPVLLSSFVVSSGAPVKGVDVDHQRNLVVLAGGNQLTVLDITDSTHPQMIGSNTAGLSDAHDLILRGNSAIIADVGNGMTTYDLTNPANPTFGANVPLSLGGRLNDIAVAGNLAFGADVFFPNGVPIVDISTLGSPSPRFILNFFNTFGGGFDDDGHGIALDNLYVYLVAVNGTAFVDKGNFNGSSHLYIGQYQQVTDNFGIAPAVSIVSPQNGNSVILGSTLNVSITASDDVGVAAATLFVNGQAVSTLSSPPYDFVYPVPLNAGESLVLTARAVDFGGNIGISNTVTVATIPDPLTTAVGTVVDKSNNLITGATVTCLGLTGTSGPNGDFSIPGIPTIQGAIRCSATLVTTTNQTLHGNSTAVLPVPGGTTNIGQITIGVGSILLLADVSAPSTTALINVLVAAGNTVTVHTPEFTWDTTNPPLSGFNCVVHLDGQTFSSPLPTQSQTALESFVNNGGGFIASQWDGFERSQNIQTGLPDLVLQLWNTPGSQNCGGCSVTYNVVPGQESHPVLAGVPSSFTIFADGHDAGSRILYSTNPSTVLMTVPAGGPGVLVRQFGNGRVVNFSWAANYQTQQTLLDPNVQKLYVNAVNWACR